jgi:hypothetical protein
MTMLRQLFKVNDEIKGGDIDKKLTYFPNSRDGLRPIEK